MPRKKVKTSGGAGGRGGGRGRGLGGSIMRSSRSKHGSTSARGGKYTSGPKPRKAGDIRRRTTGYQ